MTSTIAPAIDTIDDLKNFQQQMGIALLSPEGQSILSDPEQWQTFTQSDQGRYLNGINRDQLQLYSRLINTSISETLSNIFPYCKKFFSASEWRGLSEEYRRTNPNRHFQLFRAIEQFPDYLKSHPKARQVRLLPQLAHYELSELAILNAQSEPLPDHYLPAVPDTTDELADYAPYWNPVRQFNVYDYNIPNNIEQLKQLTQEEKTTESIIKAFQDIPTESTAIILYRAPETLKARFFQLAPLTAEFYAQSQSGQSYQTVLDSLQSCIPALNTLPKETLYTEGLKLLTQCSAQGILPGSLPI